MKNVSDIHTMLFIPLLTQLQTRDVCVKHLDAPAVYYGMVSKDSVLYHYSAGKNAETGNQPINEHSQFALFSITKVFTAIAVLQLAEQKKISLDDEASAYLPEYDFLKGISIRQLLTHQSGLNNPLPISWVHLEEEDHLFDFEHFSHEILTSKAKQGFEPGKKASYSNLNFLVLGEIISKVSGIPYQQYINEYVLNTTGIGFQWNKELAVTGYHGRGVSGMLLGLLIDKSKFTKPKEGNLIPFKRCYLNGAAYGGLIASPWGLNEFLQELLKPDNQILNQFSMNEMFTEQSLSNSRPSGHSAGWFTGDLGGIKYVHHAGGGGGFYLELRIYPTLKVATYVLTNKSGFTDKRILDKLDSELLVFSADAS